MHDTRRRLLIEVSIGLILSFAVVSINSYTRLRQASRQIQDLQRQAASARATELSVRAAQLAAQSQLLDPTQGMQLTQSGLLAVEAARNGQSLEADQALRHFLGLAAPRVGSILDGEGSDLPSVVFSGDGRFMAFAGGGQVKVATVPELVTVAFLPSGYSTQVAFSPDGQYVAASGWGGATVWNVRSQQQVMSWPNQQASPIIAFSPDSNLIAWSAKNIIQVWELHTKKEALEINAVSRVDSLLFSPDGKEIFTGSDDGKVRVWDAQSSAKVLELNAYSEVWKLVMSADGSIIAARAGRNYVIAWYASSGSRIFWNDDVGNGDVSDIAISPQGYYIAVGTGNGLARVWTLRNGQRVAQVAHHGAVLSLAFSPDSRYVLSTSWDGPARLWLAGNGQDVAMYSDASVHAAIFSPDGQRLATAGCVTVRPLPSGDLLCERAVRLWALAGGAYVADIPQRSINTGMFNPANHYQALVGVNDGIARVFDTNGHEVLQLTLGGPGTSLLASYSPNGRYILTRSSADHSVLIWDAASGQKISGRAHSTDLLDAVFSPDSRYVASASVDGVIAVWEASNGRAVSHILQPDLIRNLMFSPDGKYIAAIDLGRRASDVLSPVYSGAVGIWSAQSGQQVAEIRTATQVYGIAFSPDGRFIVSGGGTDRLRQLYDGTVSIREAPSGREVAAYPQPGSVGQMIFTSDGKSLITGSGDGTIVIWDMQARKESARLLNADQVYGFNSLDLSPDNRYLLAGGHPSRIWDLQSDTTQVEERTTRDANNIAVTQSRTVPSKRLVAQFSIYNASWARFSPDGRTILTTGCDVHLYAFCNETHVYILDWRTEDLALTACGRLSRNFTREEWAEYFPSEEYRATCPNPPSTPMITR